MNKLKIIMNGDKLFTASPISLNLITVDDYKPYGDLYGDFYVSSVISKDGKIENYLIPSGKFYIREYFQSLNEYKSYHDILIDPETLEDVTNPLNPIFIGCDLSNTMDATYYCGEYLLNE